MYVTEEKRKQGRPKQEHHSGTILSVVRYDTQEDYEKCKQAASSFGQRLGIRNMSYSAWAAKVLLEAAERELGE